MNRQMDPFLRQLVERPDQKQERLFGEVVGALTNVVNALEKTGTVSAHNIAIVADLVDRIERITDESQNSRRGDNIILGDLSSALKKFERVAENLVDVVQSLTEKSDEEKKNFTANRHTLQEVDKNLAATKKAISELTKKLAEPLSVSVNQPTQNPEFNSPWNSLVVEVVDRNFQGNIETVRIRRET